MPVLQSEPIDFAKQNEDDYEPPFEALKKQQQQILEQDYPSRQQKLNCVLYLSRIGMDLKQLCEDYGVTREEVIVAQTRPVDMFQEWLETYSMSALAAIVSETLEPIANRVPERARNGSLPAFAMTIDMKSEIAVTPEVIVDLKHKQQAPKNEDIAEMISGLERKKTKIEEEFDLERYIRREISKSLRHLEDISGVQVITNSASECVSNLLRIVEQEPGSNQAGLLEDIEKILSKSQSCLESHKPIFCEGGSLDFLQRKANRAKQVLSKVMKHEAEEAFRPLETKFRKLRLVDKKSREMLGNLRKEVERFKEHSQ